MQGCKINQFSDTNRRMQISALIHRYQKSPWSSEVCVETPSISLYFNWDKLVYSTHLSVGIFVRAREAQLASWEEGHVHWPGHCPLTLSKIEARNTHNSLKHNIILCCKLLLLSWRSNVWKQTVASKTVALLWRNEIWKIRKQYQPTTNYVTWFVWLGEKTGLHYLVPLW